MSNLYEATAEETKSEGAKAEVVLAEEVQMEEGKAEEGKAEEPKINYRDLIREVYLDSIRTVIAIDDEFPTLDSLLDKELGTGQPWEGKGEDLEKVKGILEFSRGQEKPWIVDIYDGKDNKIGKGEGIAPLHHSDLIILDYHLEGGDSRDKAIGILRELARADHFNMVVVYTRGYDHPGTDIAQIVSEIALGLTTAEPALKLAPEEEETLAAAIRVWEAEDGDIYGKLISDVSAQTYLAIRSKTKTGYNVIPDVEETIPFNDRVNARPAGIEINKSHLLRKLLFYREEKIKNQFCPFNVGDVSISPSGSETNWVRTDRLFVTVVNKKLEPKDIPLRLLDALNCWCPKPHRLLMAKMRSLISERGVVAEGEILSSRFVQAGWLMDLLDSGPQNKDQKIRQTINRHWEALGDNLISGINEFGQKLLQFLSFYSKKEIFGIHCTDVDTTAEVANISKAFNCYVSTKPVEGYHLNTGHVFELSGEGEKEYYLCLSPACDLVPGQRSDGWFNRLPGYMPFIAVSLSEIKDDKFVFKGIYQNIFLFLNLEGSIRTFAFNPKGDIKANITWEQMFAKSSGTFSSDKKKFTVGRLADDSTQLKIDSVECRVVTQLRYEYALNLLQRLGGSLSRIGLDFKRL